MLRQALAIRERVYGPVHPSVASTLNELGNIAYQRDHYDEAIVYCTRMLDIYRKIYERQALPDRGGDLEPRERDLRRRRTTRAPSSSIERPCDATPTPRGRTTPNTGIAHE